MTRIFIGLLFLAVCSCKKDKDTPVCKLVSVHYSDGIFPPSYLNYEYDDSGRVIKEIWPGGSNIYHYYKDSVIKDEGHRRTVYYLNASGLALYTIMKTKTLKSEAN